MENLNYPVSIYYYRRHVKPDGTVVGTRWDYVKHEGKEQPDLICERKVNPDKGMKLIILNKQAGERKPGCPEQSLFWNEQRPLIKNGKEILRDKVTGFFVPDEKRPGCGFGEINNNRDAVLIRKTDSDMMIMVFEGEGNGGALVLFSKWGTGAVRESISSNNVILSTVSVQPNPE